MFFTLKTEFFIKNDVKWGIYFRKKRLWNKCERAMGGIDFKFCICVSSGVDQRSCSGRLPVPGSLWENCHKAIFSAKTYWKFGILRLRTNVRWIWGERIWNFACVLTKEWNMDFATVNRIFQDILKKIPRSTFFVTDNWKIGSLPIAELIWGGYGV